jgi:hypothetical protein
MKRTHRMVDTTIVYRNNLFTHKEDFNALFHSVTKHRWVEFLDIDRQCLEDTRSVLHYEEDG